MNINDDAVVNDLFLNKDMLGVNLKINLKNKIWRGSSKLMFGSLVVFSSDNFKKSLSFGVVRKNDPKENEILAKNMGYILIGVEII